MLTVGETLKFAKSGRVYLVCRSDPYDTVLRSDDGLASIVWTRDVINAIQDGRIVKLNS